MAGICLVMAGLLAGFALLIHRNEAAARRALADRYETRAALSASFAQDFVDDLAERERSQAERLLATPVVSSRAFEDVVNSFDFDAGVLVDGRGNVLQEWPPQSDRITGATSAAYTSLRTANAAVGHDGLTVASASQGAPMTAVAVPYVSAAGTRVFSGAFAPTSTLLGSFLDSGIAGGSGTADLLDQSGDILVSSVGTHASRAELGALPVGTSQLASKTGSFTAAVADVPALPWKIVLVTPNVALYAPVRGGHWAPWALWLALAGSELLALILFVRLGRARAFAATTAHTDALTGLPNRRAMQELLSRSAASSTRHGTPLAALMIDIDHFKTINDTYGHDVGDTVIQATATALVESTRDADVAGRWGGEEFLILLNQTDATHVRAVAERARLTIATATVVGHPEVDRVTASIGLAMLRNGDADLMLREADAALYVAKANGRNRVEVAPDPAVMKTGAAGAHL